jgi:hypothetical protein
MPTTKQYLKPALLANNQNGATAIFCTCYFMQDSLPCMFPGFRLGVQLCNEYTLQFAFILETSNNERYKFIRYTDGQLYIIVSFDNRLTVQINVRKQPDKPGNPSTSPFNSLIMCKKYFQKEFSTEWTTPCKV